MKFAEINKKYTEAVTSYMMKGYIVNTATMNGSQGEIAHIDLTDGKEIIRVMLESFHDFESDIGKNEWFDYDGVKLVVGRCTDAVKPNSCDAWKTLWNQHLEVISCEKFFKIGRGNEFYGTKEEAESQKRKNQARYLARNDKNEKVFSDKAKEIVLPFMRRQKLCKSIKLSDIEKVVKVVERNYHGEIKVAYKVIAKNTSYKLA